MRYQSVKLSEEEMTKLIKAAKDAAKNAFAPWCQSENGVGAALLTEDNKIYLGCNVESVIAGEGTCAERCAIHNAVANRKYKYKAIAVVGGSSKSKKLFGPCGDCRQVIYEFSQINHKDILIVMEAPGTKKFVTIPISKYLPRGFGFEEYGGDIERYRKR